MTTRDGDPRRDSNPKLETINELRTGQDVAGLLERLRVQAKRIEELEAACYCPTCGAKQPAR
jgi:hypothetical protein